jgi:hypothetical protein
MTRSAAVTADEYTLYAALEPVADMLPQALHVAEVSQTDSYRESGARKATIRSPCLVAFLTAINVAGNQTRYVSQSLLAPTQEGVRWL